MAKFVKQTSDIAQALNRLQGLAENLISFETKRRVQLGREKEARMVDAYQYMLGNEEQEIAELEGALDSITQNLSDRGIEHLSLGPEHKTMEFEALLSAANEGAVELINAKVEDSRNYRDSLHSKKSKAMQIKRQIDMFDDAISLADPKHFGDPRILDAEDVAEAARLYIAQEDVLDSPEMQQRLEELQRPKELARLQEDIYDKITREAEQQLSAVTAGATEDAVSLEKLKSVKKETQEAVGAQLPLFELRESYGPLLSVQSELLSGISRVTGDELTTNETSALQQEEASALRALGATFYPWIASPDISSQAAANLRSAIMSSSGVSGTGQAIPPRYDELLSYFQVANVEYNSMLDQGNNRGAEDFKAEMNAMFGVDVSDTEWIAKVMFQNDIAPRVDIEEGEIYTRRSMSILPEIEEPGEDKTPTEVKYGF